MKQARGYFGVGVERISKARNLGTILRTSHAFGASFGFTIGSPVDAENVQRAVRSTDTSGASGHMPLFEFDGQDDFKLPRDCTLVGVELCERSLHLPSFRHPARAAYILGPERGSLSPEMEALCDHVVAIPTRFCVNVGVACALVLYDRTLQTTNPPERPIRPGGPLLSDVQGWVNPGSERVPFSRN